MSTLQEFPLPEAFAHQSAGEIHQRMLDSLPERYDKSEGGFVHDLTYPAALEKAQAVELVLAEALKNMFPLWAYGGMLDAHGAVRNLPRRPPVRATGEVTFYGEAGAQVPMGVPVSTAPEGGEAAVVFESTAAAVLPAGGSATLPVRAVAGGLSGNVAAGAIVTLDTPLAGVTAVANAAPTTGGLDEEEDEDYRLRLVAYDRSSEEVGTGSPADYRRWALQVGGVGSAKVVPAQDGTGTVTLVITDSAGRAASEALCAAVYDHIMAPGDPPNQLAPLNAALSVIPPANKDILISARLTLADGTTLEMAKASFLAKLQLYYVEAVEEGAVKLSKVGRTLLAAAGVLDYAALTLGGAAANVALEPDELPFTSAEMVVFTT